MKYEYFYEPISHLIVEDFFTEEEYDSLFDLIKKIEPHMKLGKYSTDKDLYVNSNIKQNLNFWPYFHREIRESNLIGNLIESKMWSKKMREIYHESIDSTFQYYHKTNNANILISKYVKGNFYNWHQDLIKSITGNIWLSKDYVEGGNLILKSVHGKEKEIKYKNNTCIFFPSECDHKVTEIINDCERFSIQYFAYTLYESYDFT